MMRRTISSLSLTLLLVACGDDGASGGAGSTGGSSNGGQSEGGSAQGGESQGGSAQGGSAQGGSAQGGSAQGGSAQGGSAQGGSAQGGSAQGGSAQGGSAQGGSAQGGSAQGGAGGGQGAFEQNCADGIDEDADSDIDCDDTDCALAPACGRLVINEIDYDIGGADTAEFIEIYNSGMTTVSLDSVVVVLLNGANGSLYASIELSGALAPGSYALVASPNVPVPNGVLSFALPGESNQIQNGPFDGVILMDSSDLIALDSLSYEGDAGTWPVLGIDVDVSEGLGFAGAELDTDVPNRSVARFPNGSDTNDNAVDFTLTTMPTPGAANVVPALENCMDGIDNNNDNQIDCAEAACAGQGCGPFGLTCELSACVCAAGDAEIDCTGGVDDNCNGMVDCADADCAADPACLSVLVSSVNMGVIAHRGTLVLNGSGFSGATAVRVGNVAQSFVVDSDTQITIPALDEASPIGVGSVVVDVGGAMSPPFGVTVIRLMINELDYDQAGSDTFEFVELRTGVPNADLTGYSLVFWNGATDLSYMTVGLSATTDANGLLVVGNSGVVPAPALVIGNGTVQQGVDAISLYQGLPANFPNGTAITSQGLLDAMVYGAAPDAGLSPLLLVDGVVVEGMVGASLARCGNALRDMTGTVQNTPSPSAPNLCP